MARRDYEGNGKAAVFIDATEEQRQALVPILTAEDPGLPWEILAATLTELHGPFFETIEIQDAGIDSTVRVGDRYVMNLQSFNYPVTGEKREVHMVLPTGFIFTDGHIGTSSENRVSADGVAFNHPGQNAYYSEVEWSSEKRMAPAPGLTPSR